MNDNNGVLLEGIISVEAALLSGNREIYTVYVDKEKIKKRDRKIMNFLDLLTVHGIRAQVCSRDLIDSYAAEKSSLAGNTSGGVIAFCGERKYTSINALILKMRQKCGYSVFLDGIEDPYNFGYCIRSLYAAGVCGIIVPKRNWLSVANVCARASAGASELCDICEYPDSDQQNELSTGSEQQFCNYLKQKGIGIVCAAKTACSIPYTDFTYSSPFVLFIGGEKRGISKEYMLSADKVLHIPYCDDSIRYSLPTATVAAIMGFELQKK